MKVYPSDLPDEASPAKKEFLPPKIRVVLIESVQLLTALLVLVGIDALFASIWPKERTHHWFLNAVVFAGWLVLIVTLGIFRKSQNVGAGKGLYLARFLIMVASWTLWMTVVDSWSPNFAGMSSILFNVIGGVFYAGIMTLFRWDEATSKPSESK